MRVILLAAAALLAQERQGPIQPLPRRPQPSAPESGARIRVTSREVLIPVNVATRLGRFIEGLGGGDFRLWDDGVEQRITRCYMGSGAAHTVIVLDQSESMKRTLPVAYEALTAFVSSREAGSSASVISVRDRATMHVAPTRDGDALLRALGPVAARGVTALFDGIYLGLDHLIKVREPRKALLVISDGGDNSSRYRAKDLRALAMEAGAQVYAVAVGTPYPVGDEAMGQDLMKDLSDETGGLYFHAKRPKDVGEIVGRIDPGAHYVLAYTPETAPDGRTHRVEVKLTAKTPRGTRVTWRRSYVAPE